MANYQSEEKLLMRFGLLVACDGEIEIRTMRKSPSSETWGSWTKRVLGVGHDSVSVLRQCTPPPQTRVSTLRQEGSGSTLQSLLRASFRQGVDSSKHKLEQEKYKFMNEARAVPKDAFVALIKDMRRQGRLEGSVSEWALRKVSRGDEYLDALQIQEMLLEALSTYAEKIRQQSSRA